MGISNVGWESFLGGRCEEILYVKNLVCGAVGVDGNFLNTCSLDEEI